MKERSSVLQTKEKLFSSWNELIVGKTGVPRPLSAQHIRIRDGKVTIVLLQLFSVVAFFNFFRCHYRLDPNQVLLEMREQLENVCLV